MTFFVPGVLFGAGASLYIFYQYNRIRQAKKDDRRESLKDTRQEYLRQLIQAKKKDDFAPATEVELESWMKKNCFNFDTYSINGNSIYEGYGIERLDDLFIWYYTERGQKNTLKTFPSEKEIVEYAFGQIRNDKWARTHCIGFTGDRREKEELAGILRGMSVEFFQDQIPFEVRRPAYRTFVLGCDVLKVEGLKDKYYKFKRG